MNFYDIKVQMEEKKVLFQSVDLLGFLHTAEKHIHATRKVILIQINSLALTENLFSVITLVLDLLTGRNLSSL